ncbi:MULTISPECIES: hypothetical protein [unclassified Okeania]|nr:MULTISPECIES: hypothetical protein [unclassified Okeania]
MKKCSCVGKKTASHTESDDRRWWIWELLYLVFTGFRQFPGV